jgi:pimeloyl-ACP methyl ester carboxylesterase
MISHNPKHELTISWRMAAVSLIAIVATTAPGHAQPNVLSFDRFVPHVSTIPAIAGQEVQLFVRERVDSRLSGSAASYAGLVVLFVHGATIPSEAVFDPGFSDDYSILAALANRGFDAFAMDLTTFGASTRPSLNTGPLFLMDDKCNVPVASRLLIGPIEPPCGSMPYQAMVRNAGSDLDDIDAVIDYLREKRGVDRVHLVGYSDGGRAAGQYAILHPDKIDRLVLVAPSYARIGSDLPPAKLPQPLRVDASGQPLRTAGSVQVTNKARFVDGWNTDIASDTQVDAGVQDAVWESIQATDPLGATWGAGVSRHTVVSWWGWTQSTVTGVQAPTLLISGTLDRVSPNVSSLFADMTATDRVFLSVEGTSHLIFWENQRWVLSRAIHQWLLAGRLEGLTCGSALATVDKKLRRVGVCDDAR